MLRSALSTLLSSLPARSAQAHCDGPCGVYDPASARIAAEAVVSMTKKLLELQPPSGNDSTAWATYNNTFSRYVAIKEEQAQQTKNELLILWTDYFKPEHLATFPNLHDIFWKAAKLCSACKVNIDQSKADELLKAVETIHNMFWKSKGRNDTWVTAS
ncbi:MAG: superoxide dismutase, Ni [Prochlorococcus sp.]|jgi:nickel superoxide dismutase|nr:superoxide dismutase, Ni [Prochlorococcaceae cyanobacterium ETNP2_MAG_10]MDP6321718.1 superoxide dismutase, Ni [Prochlorococcaceae cyanobacterium ETNP14_MAG_5]MDP6852068.1 superoxide dismutase, Ni [Prochlorococcaceae cyanobacterium ETNP1_MAG_8]HJL68538.1 superoxide dismutase, Ni [Prochlorococcaceae cyanobacterium Gl_MAG_24]|tara:strand:- start:158 stop:631 length:474 start_codon:yes stop_codon:yes gene_type:complete